MAEFDRASEVPAKSMPRVGQQVDEVPARHDRRPTCVTGQTKWLPPKLTVDFDFYHFLTDTGRQRVVSHLKLSYRKTKTRSENLKIDPKTEFGGKHDSAARRDIEHRFIFPPPPSPRLPPWTRLDQIQAENRGHLISLLLL